MNIRRIYLGIGDVFLDQYLHEPYREMGQKGDEYPEKRPAMLVIPGGGYSNVSKREGEPVALEFFCRGYETFVLNYSLKEAIRHSRPEEEGHRALMHIASLPSVDAARIAVIGFSAGGHVAACLANHAESLGHLGLIKALVLCYPVITMDEHFAHKGSREKITGLDPELLEYYSLEKNIPEEYPAVFIWTTAADELVPAENSIHFFSALREKGHTAELHIYPEGMHGLALATPETGITERRVSHWIEEAFRFLDAVMEGA